jgi:hypothetical protein
MMMMSASSAAPSDVSSAVSVASSFTDGTDKVFTQSTVQDSREKGPQGRYIKVNVEVVHAIK